MDLDETAKIWLRILSGKEGKHYYYHLGSREFELPELKTLSGLGTICQIHHRIKKSQRTDQKARISCQQIRGQTASKTSGDFWPC